MPQSHDPNSGLSCVYDAWNRLVQVSQGMTTLAQYEYDGLNRRIVRTEGGVTVHSYYNEDWQELEVRRETSPGTQSAQPLEQFIWHAYYVDALATRFWDADVDGMALRVGSMS